MADKNYFRKKAEGAAHNAMKGEDGGEEEVEVEETETETVEEDAAPDEAPMDVGAGAVPPPVVEALESLPLPALDAVISEAQRIKAEKQGGDEMGGDDMGAGGDMGAAPPMPMPGM